MDAEHDFNNIIANANSLTVHVTAINDVLAKTSLRLNKNNIDGVLDKIIKDEYKHITFYADLEGLFKDANAISNQLINFKNKLQSTDHFEIARTQSVRKAERHDMWKLWAQKSVRWVAGIFLAVVVYSTLVAWSESSDFIKVPLRDMIVAEKAVAEDVSKKVVEDVKKKIVFPVKGK